MKKLFLVAAVIGFSLAVCQPASALWGEFTEKGTMEFGGSFSYVSQDEVSTMNLAPEFNYFGWQNISIGGILEYEKITDIDATTILLLAPRYYLDVKNEGLYPYASLLLNLEKDDTAIGFGVGAKKLILKNSLLNIGIRYLAKDESQLKLFAGFTMFFRK
ncbi:MAG: hypothetical protein JXJ19_04645 [Elusimicrobia bacterium]|nr:hypothetical protein [Elusimicrobiota bacterium]